ncbi:MAG: Nucleoside-diphosphate-sugar epimerases, partial [uncultured Rubellimicrobium sp.]
DRPRGRTAGDADPAGAGLRHRRDDTHGAQLLCRKQARAKRPDQAGTGRAASLPRLPVGPCGAARAGGV